MFQCVYIDLPELIARMSVFTTDIRRTIIFEKHIVLIFGNKASFKKDNTVCRYMFTSIYLTSNT